MTHVTAESDTSGVLPQPGYIYSNILEIGKDIGPAFLSGSCWPRTPLKCGALAPKTAPRPQRGTPDPGSSWLLWRPLWSTGCLAPTQTDASATRTGSLPGHSPLLWWRLGQKRRVRKPHRWVNTRLVGDHDKTRSAAAKEWHSKL